MNYKLALLSLIFLLLGPASPLIAAILVLAFLLLVQIIFGNAWVSLPSKKPVDLSVLHTTPAASHRASDNVDTLDLKKRIMELRQSLQPSTNGYMNQLGDQ